jgi:inorganic pyrophosphatase
MEQARHHASPYHEPPEPTMKPEPPTVGDSVRVCVEVSAGDLLKRRGDGAVDFVSPLPCPFNYGGVPGIYAADGDELDALVLGPRLRRGAVVSTTLRAVVVFDDAGHADDKLVCSDRPLSRRQRLAVVSFFRVYAQSKRLLYLARGQWRAAHYRGLSGSPR